MERHFEKELELLTARLVDMGRHVREALKNALDAVEKDDAALARTVFETEQRVNRYELEIDNGVVDILALQQPVARDLRLILSILKINNDLERIGDHAVNIAESASGLAATPGREALIHIPEMSRQALAMFDDAMTSFTTLDAALAQRVLQRDDEVDALNREMISSIVRLIKADQAAIEGNLELARISRNLERVADLATNIAEEVIFYTQAKFVKHHAADGQ
ncbi:MAG: phosphate signaling complex protein PhoU [Bacteroidetes bacterium]|nr:MAG: phosphate signaling complex protein PhoU [Bacteroidota bacterium]